MDPGLAKGSISARVRLVEVTNPISFSRDGSAQKQGSWRVGTAQPPTRIARKSPHRMQTTTPLGVFSVMPYKTHVRLNQLGYLRDSGGKHMGCSSPGQARGAHPFQRPQGHTMPNFCFQARAGRITEPPLGCPFPHPHPTEKILIF